MKCISRILSQIGDPRSGQFRDLSIISQWEKVVGIGILGVGILRPVTTRHIAKVISGLQRSPAVFRQ